MPYIPGEGHEGGSRHAANAPQTRLGIPLIYGVDSVHGHGNLVGATVFLHNVGLGDPQPRLVEQVEHVTASKTRATGPQGVFAPCVCVARDLRWGRTYEGFSEDPDLVIREGFGDVGGPLWQDNGVPREPKTMRLNATDRAAVDRVCGSIARCVFVVVPGRPLILTDQLPEMDALVASWLPGSQGEGVADVLFGYRRFTGRLSLTWPRTPEQEPINVGDRDYHPLFPYGFGLRARRR